MAQISILVRRGIEKERVKNNLGYCAEDVLWTNRSVRCVSAVFIRLEREGKHQPLLNTSQQYFGSGVKVSTCCSRC